jgi:DNA-binding response OmpR family regulator
VIIVDDLRLDTASHRCWRADIVIELTAREFALLEYLAVRAGTVVSKTELVEHVWDQARDPDTNVVEVYIGYLRRKIDTPFARPLLHTVRGAGYRLSADGD